MIALTLALLPLVAGADEKIPVLQAGNVTYSNITVTTVSATDVYFTYAGGMCNVKLKNLSPELQQHFNFDPNKANEVEKQQAENKLKYHDQLLHQPVVPPPDMTRPTATASGQTAAPGKKIWAKILMNQKAPELVVEKWLTPEPDRRGKFVLIDFWATWCPPCRAAIPELNGFQRKFGDKLVVIGISDEPEAAVRRLTDPKIEYAVAIDTQARTKKAVEVAGIPHVLIIDPQGIVRWEGFPFLAGYELNENVVADIIAKYSN
ncbi:MAG: TlpA disulfide reductase family protein [Verrucomicrobiae bacterium]|nr:TlpA disulfide reductase family protein [Verrucomicrobiae bacterium]